MRNIYNIDELLAIRLLKRLYSNMYFVVVIDRSLFIDNKIYR